LESVALGPVGGPLGRVTRGGRGWEGPGTDPYLTGIQMEELVKGMQGAGVIACSKVWSPKTFTVKTTLLSIFQDC